MIIEHASTRFRTSPGVIARTVGSAVLLLPPNRNDPLVVSGCGAAIWHLLASEVSVEQLTEKLAAEYGQEAARIAPDVLSTVVELEACGAIEVVL